MVTLFAESKRKLLGPTYHWSDNDIPKFQEWAASWDCKEAEAGNHGSLLVGDEIGVGALWEDKSQKDFKSYL